MRSLVAGYPDRCEIRTLKRPKGRRVKYGSYSQEDSNKYSNHWCLLGMRSSAGSKAPKEMNRASGMKLDTTTEGFVAVKSEREQIHLRQVETAQ